jgi:hypothetical protein
MTGSTKEIVEMPQWCPYDIDSIFVGYGKIVMQLEETNTALRSSSNTDNRLQPKSR